MVAGEAPERRQERAGPLESLERRHQPLADLAHADQRDEGLEDLVGPLADRVDPGIAHHPLVGLVGEIALAAVDLERLVDALPERLGREDLEDRRLEHVVLGAAVDQGGGLVGRRLHRIGGGGEVGDLLLDELEVGQRPAELDAAGGVPRGRGEADLGQPRATGAEGRPAEVEHRERDLQPLAERAEDVRRRHGHVMERQAGRRRAADAALGHPGLDDLEARHVGRDQERGDLRVAAARVGRPGHDGQHAGDRPVGDVALAAVEDVGLAVLGRSGERLHIAGVGAGLFLGQRERRERLAA